MSKNKTKHSLSDEKKSEVASRAICDIIKMSANEDFKRKCNSVLETSECQSMEKAISDRFMKFTIKTRKRKYGNFFEGINDHQREDMPQNYLIHAFDDLEINIIEELEGFDQW